MNTCTCRQCDGKRPCYEAATAGGTEDNNPNIIRGEE